MATSKISLEVYNPTGATEVTQVAASLLHSLENKTVWEISNRAWEADRTFPAIRQVLQKRFSGIKIVPYTELRNITVDLDSFGDLVKTGSCDAVIVGNAA